MTITNNIKTCWALIKRDLYVLKKTLRSDFIDSAIILVISILMCKYFLPQLGMPLHFIPDLYIGGYINILLLSAGFTFAMNISYALPHGHIVEYQLSLPLPKHWVMIKYIVQFVIQTAITTIPLMLAGIMVIAPKIPFSLTKVFVFCGTYSIILIFIATFFLQLCFSHDYTWFKENTWPRRLSPMICLGAAFTPWKALHTQFPIIGKLFLLNPSTFICEALRASLIGESGYISLWISVVILLAWTGIFSVMLIRGITKQLDPV